MEYVIKSRNMDLNDSIKEYADKKIKKRISKFLDKIIKIEIELEMEKNPSINLSNVIEVTVFTSGAVIRAADSASDVFEAIDKVSNKIERQIKRYRNKLIQRARKVSSRRMEQLPEENQEQDLKKKIVKTKSFVLKPMSPEEAVMQMELLGHDFFVFVNSETEQTSVVYRRKDDNYGLIEPTT